ncbi:hypothetical protein A8C56_07985 [Niabella ginsenosidivorans]|uniref:Sugar 3,4-ketoisomerase QdtA cupin domain-containing protein n=1 Tax=Niabella ginsenosidivorans TaxID=1176587 RepID=A0A1A9I1K0_9BACT|nr:hypothetical protein [Niabella ginsenosidivorans]ANH80929.1 hypothetical protein A8C56_07985 [Niabella ginsenosidivorans]
MFKSPNIIEGTCYKGGGGILNYNNDFDTTPVKRIHTIQNSESNSIRGWQEHKIEQRWFITISGSFDIDIITIDDWAHPPPSLAHQQFRLEQEKLDVLHIPSGHITGIHSLIPSSSWS